MSRDLAADVTDAFMSVVVMNEIINDLRAERRMRTVAFVISARRHRPSLLKFNRHGLSRWFAAFLTTGRTQQEWGREPQNCKFYGITTCTVKVKSQSGIY